MLMVQKTEIYSAYNECSILWNVTMGKAFNLFYSGSISQEHKYFKQKLYKNTMYINMLTWS